VAAEEYETSYFFLVAVVSCELFQCLAQGEQNKFHEDEMQAARERDFSRQAGIFLGGISK
jgi:hypothetical protein